MQEYVDQIEFLQQELDTERGKNEKLRYGLKKVSQSVIMNNELISQVQVNEKANEALIEEAFNNQGQLLNNFSSFKGYVEKILGNFTQKLVDYNKKEQMCKEITKENEVLRQKYRDMVEKLKYVSGMKG